MATNSRLKTIPKAYGTSGMDIMTCSFTTSGSTAAVTVLEQQGCTVSRTGVGAFTVVPGKVYKNLTVSIGVIGASTAQLHKIDSKSASGRSVVIGQVTAGSDTHVDTMVATIDVIIIGRSNS